MRHKRQISVKIPAGVSTGNRILTPADDPVASVRLLQLEQVFCECLEVDPQLAQAAMLVELQVVAEAGEGAGRNRH